MSDTQNLINKTREYLDYVQEHYNNVQRAWKVVKDKCSDMRVVWDGWFFHILNCEIKYHDASKLSAEEFTQYRDAFFPVAEKKPLGNAWEHHKKCNDHHWETWTNKKYAKPIEWQIHCTHMVIDWMAMGYKFGDTAQEFYEKNKDKIKIPDYAVKFIYEIFDRIRE